jgi:hypothetical protein
MDLEHTPDYFFQLWTAWTWIYSMNNILLPAVDGLDLDLEHEQYFTASLGRPGRGFRA